MFEPWVGSFFSDHQVLGVMSSGEGIASSSSYRIGTSPTPYLPCESLNLCPVITRAWSPSTFALRHSEISQCLKLWLGFRRFQSASGRADFFSHSRSLLAGVLVRSLFWSDHSPGNK